jgi:hypothetical protein
MLQVATKDDWALVMLDLSRNTNNCDKGIQECGSDMSYYFFIIFIILSNYLILNVISLLLVD